MGLPEALGALNELTEKGVIQDYAIGGGQAVIYHNIPYSSYDLDIFAILRSDEDYRAIYQHFREKGNKIEDVFIYIEDTPVQILPNISPLYDEAIEQAHQIEIDGVLSKIVRVEHLIVIALETFRFKDKIRIAQLLEKVNKDFLDKILNGFDDEKGTLRKRYKSILAGT
ncbi:nucleotidyltransferase [Chloroflexota bacterium]